MFTGIIQKIAPIESVEKSSGLTRVKVAMSTDFVQGLGVGASVSVDGVCLTVVSIDDGLVAFDVIAETLQKTTLKNVYPGKLVNLERAAKFGDEIGGHILSGHIYDTASILSIERHSDYSKVSFQGSGRWTKYLFCKGYIAIDGISLTLVDVGCDHTFTVCLIPETLRQTTLGQKHAGDLVNIEIDAQMQALVDTVERINGRSILYDRET